MPETDINQAINTSNAQVDYSVAPEETDAALDQKETKWRNQDWSKQLGYYKKIPELQTAVDAKANWTMGAGFEADPDVQLNLSIIKGFGKDTFNSILSNMIRTYTIGGDAFAEIIRDKKSGAIINLKPLDTGTIDIVASKAGIIKRYEQTMKANDKESTIKFEPQEILHLSRKRIADEIHGISVIEAVENIILMRNEAMDDWKQVLHRNVKPIYMIHVDSDDPTALASLKTQWDSARKDGENIIVPKGVVVPEQITTATNSSLNPLNWINQLNDYFFQAVNVPQIIIGQGKEFTDASGKITYLSYEQSVKGEQLYIEEQLLDQLGVEIELTFPASLQNELLSSVEKEPDLEAAQQNDTTAEMEGKT